MFLKYFGRLMAFCSFFSDRNNSRKRFIDLEISNIVYCSQITKIIPPFVLFRANNFIPNFFLLMLAQLSAITEYDNQPHKIIDPISSHTILPHSHHPTSSQRQYFNPIYIIITQMSGTKVVHRFLRQPNLHSDVYNRVANRFNPIANTQVSLQDPQTGRTLTLIGTTNSSTTLAHRTKVLLEKEKPDAVYVQASPQWWNYAQHLDLNTQPLFSRAAEGFPEAPYKFENHLRGILFRARYLTWRYFFESALRLPDDFNLFTPGLQTAYALKYATTNKAQTIFGGHEFDPTTVEALRLQPDLYFHTFLWRAIFTTFNTTSAWNSQYTDFNEIANARGGEAFAESIDRSRINFLVGLLSKTAPKQKSILIDLRDERIFRQLYSLKAKHTVAVVNQWHMEGVETHWRRLTGTELPKANLSPIADMDIDAIQEKTLVNEYLRDYVSEVTKSEPASWQDYSTNYHKENFEYERTRHICPDSHQDVPAPGEKPHSSHH